MNCPKYGCDENVVKSARGDSFECPVHGEVMPMLHLNKHDLRVAQAFLSLAELAGDSTKH